MSKESNVCPICDSSICECAADRMNLALLKDPQADGKYVRFSKAIFLTNFGTHLKTGIMILWEKQADIAMNLRLGKNYRFIAGLETEEDLNLLYFLPQLTKFEEEDNIVSESWRWGYGR